MSEMVPGVCHLSLPDVPGQRLWGNTVHVVTILRGRPRGHGGYMAMVGACSEKGTGVTLTHAPQKGDVEVTWLSRQAGLHKGSRCQGLPRVPTSLSLSCQEVCLY